MTTRRDKDARTGVAFHALEEGQDLSITPAPVAHLRPGIEVLGLAADKHHSVDRAGTENTPKCHAFSVEQFHARIGAINATRLSGKRVALRRDESVSVVTVGTGPAPTGDLTHARLHHRQ